MRPRLRLGCGPGGECRIIRMTGNNMSVVKKEKRRLGAPIGCKSVRTTTRIQNSDDSMGTPPEPESSKPNKRKKGPNPRTLSLRDLKRAAAKAKREGSPQGEVIPYKRPQVREDCRNKARPCLYVSCTHHLYLDVTSKGSIVFN